MIKDIYDDSHLKATGVLNWDGVKTGLNDNAEVFI